MVETAPVVVEMVPVEMRPMAVAVPEMGRAVVRKPV
jgi:hypothetical protein